MSDSDSDYCDCPNCGKEAILTLDFVDGKGTVKCTKCNFFSTITNDRWTVDETGKILKY